jgi:hypothetical protein
MVRVSTLDGSLSDESNTAFSITPVRHAKMSGMRHEVIIHGPLGRHTVSYYGQHRPEHLHILDLKGRLVCELEVSSGAVYWNGLDVQDRRTTPGIYMIMLESKGGNALLLPLGVR